MESTKSLFLPIFYKKSLYNDPLWIKYFTGVIHVFLYNFRKNLLTDNEVLTFWPPLQHYFLEKKQHRIMGTGKFKF